MSNFLQISHDPAAAEPSIEVPSLEIRPRTRRGAPDPIDLRRRTNSGREAARTCLERARLLPEGERAALTAVYRDGMTVKELSALRSTPARDPRSLRRQLRRISARLLSPRFAFVAGFLEPADQAERRRLGLPCWPPRRRAVAEQCIIRGLSIREAAAALRMTFHVVRLELSIISALHEAARARGA